MILKSPHDTLCLINCEILSSTEMAVGLFYAEHTLDEIATVIDVDSGKRYRIQLPESISKNKTFTTGLNQILKFEYF